MLKILIEILLLVIYVRSEINNNNNNNNRHLLVDKLRSDFLNLERKLWGFVIWEAPESNLYDAQNHILMEFQRYNLQLEQMPLDVLHGTKPIKNIHAFLFLYSEIKHTENIFQKFKSCIYGQIQMHEKLFHNKNFTIINEESVGLNDMMKDITHPKTGINSTVHQIYDLTFGEENMSKEVLDLLLKNYPCEDFNQSPQQIYYNLYNIIALNGLKSYIMLQFVYLIQKLREKNSEFVGNSTDLSDITKINFGKRVNETMSVFRGLMEITPTEVWKCDPKHHKKGETYDEFTRLLQGHIQNEVDMNIHGTCTEDCSVYTAAESIGCYDGESKYCKEVERCTGKILNCQFVESHMNICPSQNPFRRYDYIQYESGRSFGKNENCWKKPINSWWRWFVHCSYCFCICDEQGPKSDRYVNLRVAKADIKNNRVVTGLRFIKHNRILHLQIQEGKLLPYGYIDNTTVKWVPVDDYKITDNGTFNEIDYYTLTHENREMALTDIETMDNSYILTGLKFHYNKNKLFLEIYLNKFDWESGNVTANNEISKCKLKAENKINLRNADIPTNAPLSEMDYKTEYPYVEFTHSDKKLDAAQTTIPFFDIQQVINEPPVPLTGAGIFYKGKPGFGGFIAPKIKTYDYSKFINS